MLASFLLAVLGPPAPSGLDVEWDAPTSCPSREDVLAEIVEDLGSSDAAGRPLRVRGVVRADGDAFAVVLTIDDAGETSERTLRGPSCASISEAAALIVAMTVDPSLGDRVEPPAAEATSSDEGEVPEPTDEEGSATTPGPLPEPAPTSDRAPTLERAPEVTRAAEPPSLPPVPRRPRGRPRFAARAQAGVGLGPLPKVGASVALGLGVSGRGWLAEAVGQVWPPVVGNASTPGISVRAMLWTVGARGCGVPRWRQLEFPLCAGFDVGRMRARGQGAVVPKTAASTWAAAVAGAGMTWWFVRWVGLALRADGLLALRRPRFRTDPSGELAHVAGLLGLQVLAGLRVRAP